MKARTWKKRRARARRTIAKHWRRWHARWHGRRGGFAKVFQYESIRLMEDFERYIAEMNRVVW